MKVRFTAAVLLFASVLIISCSKDEDTSNNQPPDAESSLFVRMQQGLTNDTVYFVSYDSFKRPNRIVDSIGRDTLKATYDSHSANNVATLVEKHGDSSYNTTFHYGMDNNLSGFNYQEGDYQQECTFEYINNVVSKAHIADNSHNDDGEIVMLKYYTYQVTNGNITSKKEYDMSNNLLSETTFTYSSHSNVFQQFALFNLNNSLGFDDVANLETFFNKNLIASSSKGGIQTTYTYTHNSNNHLTKLVVSSPSATYTRMLSY